MYVFVTRLSVLAILLLSPNSGIAQITPLDLGTLGGKNSDAIGLNDHGQVVGISNTANGESHGFSWTRAGGMVKVSLEGGTFSIAKAVDNAGQVVGYGARPGGPNRAFVWTAGTGTVEIGTLGGTWSEASSINALGQVAGVSALAGDEESHAFVWTSTGGMVDIGIPGTLSYATAISDAGHIVGTMFYLPDLIARAFLWTEAQGMKDLGSLGGQRSDAHGVNIHGRVAGASTLPAEVPFHGFSWTATEGLVDLTPDRNSSAIAVNAPGQIVGFQSDADGNGRRATSWTLAGGLVEFGPLDSAAVDVNERGLVAGSYFDYVNGGHRGFVWTPARGMVTLGLLPDGDTISAVAVNAVGQVAGYGTAAHGEPGPRHAVLWHTSPACDADIDGGIDQDDLAIIRGAMGQTASRGFDPRDGNADGAINIADLRFCGLRAQR